MFIVYYNFEKYYVDVHDDLKNNNEFMKLVIKKDWTKCGDANIRLKGDKEFMMHILNENKDNKKIY